MGNKERRGVNVKGLLRKNWLLIATVVSVLLGMWKPLHVRSRSLRRRHDALSSCWRVFLPACRSVLPRFVIRSRLQLLSPVASAGHRLTAGKRLRCVFRSTCCISSSYFREDDGVRERSAGGDTACVLPLSGRVSVKRDQTEGTAGSAGVQYQQVFYTRA